MAGPNTLLEGSGPLLGSLLACIWVAAQKSSTARLLLTEPLRIMILEN
jgi:hypothetical protein